MRHQFGLNGGLTEIIPSIARLALDCIANSDALYHDVEHTLLVTLVGHDIMAGKAFLSPMSPGDYANFIVACLLHDIGYVRGILWDDGNDGHLIDANGGKVRLPRGASDAALSFYHVDRSKLYVTRQHRANRRSGCCANRESHRINAIPLFARGTQQ